MTPPSFRRLGFLLAIIVLMTAVAGGAYWFVDARKPHPSVSALCARLAETSLLDDALVTLDPTTLGPQVSALQRAVEAAPSDIRPQLKELTTFVAEVADEVGAANTEKKKVLVEALAARQDQVDAITADGRAVETWSVTHCGTALRSPAAPTPTRGSATSSTLKK